MKSLVYALGRDPYWLTALRKATHRTAVELKGLACEGEIQQCIVKLPKADPEALILVDASGQTSIEAAVRALRAAGWRYVVVVAADPSAREAAAVLRGSLGYDYWEKSYDETSMLARIRKCLREMAADSDPDAPSGIDSPR